MKRNRIRYRKHYRMKRSTHVRLANKAEARRLILNRVFGTFVWNLDESITVADAIETLRPYVPVMKAQLRWLRQSDFFGSDLRRGWHTMGYPSDERILADLSYISDRWNCQYRLNWVLDLVELRP